MLKKRDLNECHNLFNLLIHPEVYPYVRNKANSYEEYLFLTKKMIESEDRGEVISRTITDEWGNPIGVINLFDVQDGAGFLGTWLGKPYHGKGYNKIAKELFFNELFYQLGINNIYMRIRKTNIRSIKAALKLPYVVCANESRQALYNELNNKEDIYDLFEISKDLYTLHMLRCPETSEEQLLEA
jgi:RimJ/RimL family protein N-acetyltransferase